MQQEKYFSTDVQEYLDFYNCLPLIKLFLRAIKKKIKLFCFNLSSNVIKTAIFAYSQFICSEDSHVFERLRLWITHGVYKKVNKVSACKPLQFWTRLDSSSSMGLNTDLLVSVEIIDKNDIPLRSFKKSKVSVKTLVFEHDNYRSDQQ
jgi:hypothetical protein